MRPESQTRLAELFVALADTLVVGYDLLDLLGRLAEGCAELLDDVDAAGVLLADPNGRLQTVAASDEQARALELFQLQTDDGPCPECYRTQDRVASPDLGLDLDRWPTLAPHALAEGFRAVHAYPLRLREQTVGALNLFSRSTGPVSADDGRIAQALAEVATISVLRERALAGSAELAGQLQGALESRVLVEQAKGVLAERGGLDLGAAFALLRGHARNNGRRLSDVAGDVITGDLDL